MARIFGTDRVRGLANIATITPQMIMALGRAAVHVLASFSSEGKPFLLVGCDTRLSSPMFEAALTAGICSAGADVLNVGVLPTAGVAYLVRHIGAIGGVVISASHNPYMDNRIKFFSATGTKLEDRLEEELEACISSVDMGTPPTGEAIGRPSLYEDGAGHYSDFLKQIFHYETPIRLCIGLDCANGAASAVAPALFHQLGSKIRVWHAAPD